MSQKMIPKLYGNGSKIVYSYNQLGEHRRLGMHITRIKSCKLDGWSVEEICEAEGIGNVVSNAYYECNKPQTEYKPNSAASMEQRRKYIKKKYVQKLWIDKNADCPLDEYKASVREGRKMKVSKKGMAKAQTKPKAEFAPPKIHKAQS